MLTIDEFARILSLPDERDSLGLALTHDDALSLLSDRHSLELVYKRWAAVYRWSTLGIFGLCLAVVAVLSRVLSYGLLGMLVLSAVLAVGAIAMCIVALFPRFGRRGILFAYAGLLVAVIALLPALSWLMYVRYS